MPLDGLIWSRDVDGNWHELRVEPQPGATVELSDNAAMGRIMSTDAALELAFALIKAVDETERKHFRSGLLAPPSIDFGPPARAGR